MESPTTTEKPRNDERSTPTRLSSRDLFGSQREVVIVHRGDEYRLRITSLGKLILTK